MTNRSAEDLTRVSVSLLYLSGDTLFSSVVGPSFSNSPQLSPLRTNSSGSHPQLTRCLSLSSLLDPNIDLPNMSAREVDDVLDRFPSNSYPNSPPPSEAAQSAHDSTSTTIGVVSSTAEVIQREDKPLNYSVESFTALFPPGEDTERNGGGSDKGLPMDIDDENEEGQPKRCLSAPVPFWQQDDFSLVNLEDSHSSAESDTRLLESTQSVTPEQPATPRVVIIRESDIRRSVQLQSILSMPSILKQPQLRTKSIVPDSNQPADIHLRKQTVNSELLSIFPSCNTLEEEEISQPGEQQATKKVCSTSWMVKPLLCQVSGCDETFLNEADRSEHCMAKHAEDWGNKPRYICAHLNCGKWYIAQTSLTRHLGHYHGDLVVNCPHPNCTEKFTTEKIRNAHIKTTHRDQEQPFKCHHCSETFHKEHQLTKHQRIKHSNPQHRCTSCGRMFVTEDKLKTHMRRHTGEKPHICDEPGCTKAFTRPSYLTRHKLTCHQQHLPRGGPKPVPTPPPNNPHSRGTDVGTSTSSSTPALVCPMCGEQLAGPDLLSIHLLTHGKQEVFTCPIETCAKQTPNRAEMSTHLLDHFPSSRCRILYSCPLKDCEVVCENHKTFNEHFVKHFTGEVPGDIDSLLPADLPSTEDGLELPSMTFEANVSQLMLEGTSLFHALDLMPDTMFSDHFMDSGGDHLMPSSSQILMPDLTSALTLSGVEPGLNRNKQKAGGGASGIGGPPMGQPALFGGSVSSVDKSFPPVVEQGGCARTCVVANDIMANLVKRRRALLRERITLLGYEPIPQEDSHLALKDIMLQIFHSKELPIKYQAEQLVQTNIPKEQQWQDFLFNTTGVPHPIVESQDISSELLTSFTDIIG